MSRRQPLIFRKGLDMKEAVAGELAAAYHSALVDAVRASDYRHDPAGSPCTSRASSASATASIAPSTTPIRPGARFPGPQRLPHRRDHPQPARQRAAARRWHPLPQRCRRTRARARPRRRRHPAGVRRHGGRDAPAHRARLHAGRHDLRLGAQRVEERRALRAGRLHVDHPRQDTGTRRPARPRRRR